ncbi:hypothetical protein IGI04_041590 [Brassica rapa subsp. trilocularis]|uniref:DUF8003 domain-containing protein n=1 Tax=Brassica rapa subsp. trilocularis TaxID=1813537 RepID=A0ABQ7KUL9_BRACM|nr:hypothetical protein IGI04_041590 [Brassica rapa subsp. trilocularis]
MARFQFIVFFFFVSVAVFAVNPSSSYRFAIVEPNSGLDPDSESESESESLLFHQDYSPPAPPPPPPHGPSVSCTDDLGGVGFLDTTCKIVADLNLTKDVYIAGKGNFIILPGVKFHCAIPGCSIAINVSGNFSLGAASTIVAGTFELSAGNASFAGGSAVNTTGLAGSPPSQTSGTPQGIDGAGGGHGGRGACCLTDTRKLPEDVWGGDAYSWSTLSKPWSYGSKGGSTSREIDYGGGGGGRVKMNITQFLDVNGSLLAEGGYGGAKGGGGSGGSIFIIAYKMTGIGKISACGGSGYGGGGGGRVSVDIFSRHDDPKIFVHGGYSIGCPDNSGAAGTLYDAVPRSLFVSNYNLTTDTYTLLLEFPFQPRWTNIYIQDKARATCPLLWSRVQVQGQISLLCGGVLSFGLSHYGTSVFELLAEELLMSDSIIKVYGALSMSVKMFLMWNSELHIDGGGGDTAVSTSTLEASNLFVLRESSVIRSNANLFVHGQGLLNLTGPGDSIEAQRLVLSLFYRIYVGPGSILRGPLQNASRDAVTPKLYCDRQDCPYELLNPPEDCNVNSSLSFTLQICRVEDIIVEGFIRGSVVHFHRAKTVTLESSGEISASGMGCRGGVGEGKLLGNGIGSGGGHGGKGGRVCYNSSCVEGGITYGDADLPCELGSGSGDYSPDYSSAGGGIVVIGSREQPLSALSLEGSMRADGESVKRLSRDENGSVVAPGGGSGGTVLLFLRYLILGESSLLSTGGGSGSPVGGGGGGGGRIHFHWSNIPTGDIYQPIASVKGIIHARGGAALDDEFSGKNGTVTGRPCPKGLHGIFCKECPSGTFKNVTGSDTSLCRPCPIDELPTRAVYVPVRGGVSETPCPYRCISERYHMPHCYTALEELIYTFGGPWLFGLLLMGLLILLALVLSVARMKFVGVDDLPGPAPTHHGSQIDHSFPFLESLNEVLETNRAEQSQSHVHRMYFMGPNTFSEPWHLSHIPPEEIKEIVYEAAFNTFVDEINSIAAYQWWEGAIYSILSVVAYPLAWSWQQWRRKLKLQKLREFVRSEYDHSCLRSCRSRALYEGLKVAATSDLMLAYLDFFLGGDEKRTDLPPRLHQRFPMPILFGGDGSYMAPFSLQNDNILTSLMNQLVAPTTWYRLVAGVNAQLRLVRRGRLRSTFHSVLRCYGVSAHKENSPAHLRESMLYNQNHTNTENYATRRKNYAGIIDGDSLPSLKEKRDMFFILSFLVHNTKPVGHQDMVGLVISMLLLGDFSLVLLTLLQLYSISMVDVLLALFILPLGLLLPFPAGINALFSHGPRRSAGLARVYALWNYMSLVNVVVAFLCGYVHYHSESSASKKIPFQPWNINMGESEWWIFPAGLVVCKIMQSQLINRHVANLEIQDRSLYSKDFELFWQS